MGIEEYIQALALANRHGWAFLAAYGTTWLLCALAWLRTSPRIAAYATLFQGLIALPVALALTALTTGPPRPNLAVLDSLSVVMAMGQVLGLPVVIFLVISGRYTLVPLGMVTILVVHFAPYTWLYDTLLYVVMGAVISLSAVLLTHRAEREHGPGLVVGARRVCLSTGLLMLTGAAVALLL